MSDLYDPDTSFALSASAGSGKTFALTTRLLGMLLTGVSPREIIAITFTNLAANEIRSGLFKRLSALEQGSAEETGIYAELLKTDRSSLSQRAHRLRIELIEQFSLLRVSTIHSFLGRMLFSFPKETGYILDISILDENERERMLADALEEFYRLLAVDSVLFERILDFIRVYREGRAKTEKIIRDIYEKVEAKSFVLRDTVNEEEKRSLSINSAYSESRKRLWSIETLQRVQLLADICSSYMEEYGENRNVRSFHKGLTGFIESKNPRILYGIPAFKKSEQDRMVRYLNTLLDRVSEQQSAQFRNAFGGVREEISRYLACEMDYYIDIWFDIFRRVQQFYVKKKRVRHVLDFDDIGLFSLALLEGFSDFVYLDYRLDSSIRYVLIDEFQDTSESQWEVLSYLVKRALEKGGNFFYVGDVKQSIYRFRGGEPWLFKAVKESLRLPERKLEYNFRQNELLLGFTNRVFIHITEKVFTGYGYQSQRISPKRSGEKGGFLFIEKYEKRETLHEGLIDTVRTLKKAGVVLSDIAVLCRRRTEIEEVEALLLSNHIPYKTSGRSPIMADPAVSDIVNLLKLFVRPHEPVLLAGFLRSRLAGYRYEELEELNPICFERLEAYAPSLSETLRALIKAARYSLPSEILWRTYEEFGTFQQYPQNREALVDLLELAKSFEEGTEISTIERFLQWLEENMADLPIKSGVGRGITVQTIHAAKGLEYHTVILPFLSKRFRLRLDNSLLFTRDEGGEVDSIAIAGSAYATYLSESRGVGRIIEENDTEYKIDELNIMYVAITRARENLVILPLAGRGETMGDVLMSAVDSGYGRESGVFRLVQGEIIPSTEKTERIERNYVHAREKKLFSDEYKPAQEIYQQEEPVSTSIDVRKRRAGRLKGLLFHKALELSAKLPTCDEIDELLDRAIAQVSSGYTAEERSMARERARRTLLSTIADSRLEMYFTQEAMSEVETLSVQYPNLIGRADRVVVGDTVSVVDFKTDEPGNGHGLDLNKLIRGYAPQVEKYCGSFASLFPDRRIEGWLYFTEAQHEDRLVKVYDKEES
ncbi:MAG: UvrD-helicase domain-containing protein [Spirochaetota bacterium]|nr:MAG: UvrD-helicase domain-containing protein [Spirochaetota bacterium]